MGVSFNGNPQTVKSEAQQFFELLVSTLYGKDSFYESTDEKAKRLYQTIDTLVKADKLDFIANSLVYAREHMLIRNMPVVGCVYFAKALRLNQKTFPQLRKLVATLIQRADQITDFYAVALEVFGTKGKVPMAIKRGVSDAFNKFGEYHFAKYNRPTGVKFRDVMRIVHPDPASDKQSEIFKKILEDALAVPYTWETELSINGQKPKEDQKTKTELWSELVLSGKIGYMALLRNLRNILAADVGEDIVAQVAKNISNPIAVEKSKQFPFAFLKAYNSVEQDSPAAIRYAISDALDLSVKNVPSIGKNVWVILDGSGSMLGMYGGQYKSNGVLGDCPFTTAALFAAALVKANVGASNVAVTMFSDNAEHVILDGRNSVLSMAQVLTGKVQGGGTNLAAALKLKHTLGFEPDTVVVLSDMEVDHLVVDRWDNPVHDKALNVATLFSNGCLKIAVNIASNTTTPLPERHGFMQLSGFSEKIFQFIPEMRESGKTIEKLLSKPFAV